MQNITELRTQAKKHKNIAGEYQEYVAPPVVHSKDSMLAQRISEASRPTLKQSNDKLSNAAPIQ